MFKNYESKFNDEIPNMKFNFKGRKKWAIILIVIGIIILSLVFIKDNDETTNLIDSNSNNSNSKVSTIQIDGKNITNDRIFYTQVKYGEIDSSTGLSKMDYKVYVTNTDGSNKKLLSEKSMYKLQSSNGYLYGIVDDNICRVKEDGTDFKFLTNGLMVDWFTVYDNYIYYAKEDSNASDELFDKVARINIDGSNDKIIDERSARFCIADKDGVFLVFPDGISLSKIERVDYDGNSIKVFDASASNITKVGDYIYYTNIKDNYSLYSIKFDGTDNKKISTEKLMYNGALTILSQSNGRLFYGVIEDYIYYINTEDGNKPYKIKTDGTNKTKVADYKLNILQVKGNNIYIQREFDINLKVTDKNFTALLDVTKDSVNSLWIE